MKKMTMLQVARKFQENAIKATEHPILDKILAKTKQRKLPLNSEGVPSRNELSLNSFAEYCIKHPNERFFQALTNWFGAFKIGYFDGKNWKDMWYLEEDVDYKIKKQRNKK